MVTTLELYIFTSSSIIKFIKSLRLYIPLLKRNRIEETFQRAIFTLTKILQKLFYFKLYIWRDPSYKKKKKRNINVHTKSRESLQEKGMNGWCAVFKRQKSGRTEKIRFDREANWTNSSTVTVRATVTKKKREREN